MAIVASSAPDEPDPSDIRQLTSAQKLALAEELFAGAIGSIGGIDPDANNSKHLDQWVIENREIAQQLADSDEGGRLARILRRIFESEDE